MPDPLTSRRLGRYDVQQEIGRGGMARVYRAVDTLLQRTVALKILAPQFSDDPEFAHRFEREAVTAANLRHPAIITIFDVGEAEGRRYIAMEYIGGSALSTALAEHGALSLPLTIAVLRPIAEALDAAHRANAVHRDIKPQNILIDTDGRVLLTDFGIAIGPQQGGERLTRAGSVMGTPEYLAPEQVQGQQVTGASDRYALGVVAFELLTGRAPFEGSPPELIMAHAYTAPPAITTFAPSLPIELNGLFARALAKDPAARFDHATAFIAALHGVATRLGLPEASRQAIAALTGPGESSAGQPTIAITPPTIGTSPSANPATPPSPIEDVFRRPRPAQPSPIEEVFGRTPPSTPSPIADVFAPPPAQPAQPPPAQPAQPPRQTPVPRVPPQAPPTRRPTPAPPRQAARVPAPPDLVYERSAEDTIAPSRRPIRSAQSTGGRPTTPWILVLVTLIILVLLALLLLETTGRRSNTTNSGLGAVFAVTPTPTVAQTATATSIAVQQATPVPTAVTQGQAAAPVETSVLPIEPTVPPPPATEAAVSIFVPTAEPVPTATLEPTVEPTLEPTASAEPTVTAEPTATLEPTATIPPPTTVPPTSTPLGRPTPIGDGATIVFQLDDGVDLFDVVGLSEAEVQPNAQPIGPAAISPDGTTILFDRLVDEQRQIYQWVRSTGQVTRYTQGSADAYHPSWSPDGARVAYAGTDEGNAEIYVIEADGIRRLTNDPGEDDYPSWTPDGEQLVWESSRGGQWGIYLMNASGAQQIVEPVDGANDRYPRISPDGTQVVFASDRDRDDGGYELYVQSLAGGSPVRVTTFTGGDASGPQWSPDGRMILFWSTTNGTSDIYAVRLDDGVIAPIRTTSAEERWPIWGR